MLRKLKTSVGRYKKGELHDYPKAVWEKIAKDAHMKLSFFTEEVQFNPGLQAPMRSPVRLRSRLGSEVRRTE